MILPALFFYLFSALLVACAVMVVVAKNPVHAVLYLILAFVNASGLFVLMGAEFLAMILIIVYVGAVAVLFLFVIMMLDIDFVALKQGFLQYMPFGVLVGLIFLAELVLVVGGFAVTPEAGRAVTAPIPADITNAEAIGRVMYTQYILYFQLAGLVLLVAMIGAIVLTLRHKPNVRRQDVSEQVARGRDAIEVVSVASGEGLRERAP